MPLPESLDFLIRHEFTASRLFEPFAYRRPCLVIQRDDRRLLCHREHCDGDRILIFRRKRARSLDCFFKQLRHTCHCTKSLTSISSSLRHILTFGFA